MQLSIITVNLNNLKGLKKTIDSIISQTWRDFEWIIIDGGSTDGSCELIEQYQEHFAYWCSEPDKGVYNAMNKGIAKAKGNYLNFMNSGDVFYSNDTLKRVFESSPWADMVYGDFITDNNGQNQYQTSPVEATLDFFYTNNICHQAMFIKSYVLKSEGYDEKYSICADWARWIKMVLNAATIQRMDFPICVFDLSEGLSRGFTPTFRNELDMVRQEIPQGIRSIIERSNDYKNELLSYQRNLFVQDTVMLMNERPLLCRLVHLNLILLKSLSRILRTLRL